MRKWLDTTLYHTSEAAQLLGQLWVHQWTPLTACPDHRILIISPFSGIHCHIVLVSIKLLSALMFGDFMSIDNKHWLYLDKNCQHTHQTDIGEGLKQNKWKHDNDPVKMVWWILYLGKFTWWWLHLARGNAFPPLKKLKTGLLVKTKERIIAATSRRLMHENLL